MSQPAQDPPAAPTEAAEVTNDAADAAAAPAAAPAPAEAAVEAAVSGSESDGSDEEEEAEKFTDDSVAENARPIGLKALSDGQLDAALKIQCGILNHFTTKYGEAAPQCALYYLDYGVSLLAAIQAADNEAAALAGNTGQVNEDIGLCMTVLEMARVCYDKAEDAASSEAEVQAIQVRQAEVHETLAQLYHERDEENEALKELEYALVLRQSACAPNDRAAIGTMFQIGALYLRNEEFEKAEATLAEALELAKANPDVPAQDAEDLASFLEEAREMKEQGGLDHVKEEIRGLFPEEGPAGMSMAPDLEMPGHGAAGGNSLLAAIPAELAGGTRVSHGLTSAVPVRDATSSMSFFPRQSLGGTERSSGLHDTPANTAVNTSVAVRRKERPRPTQSEAQQKQHKAENGNGGAAQDTPAQ